MTRTPARSALLAAVSALAVALAGCGSDDSAGTADAVGVEAGTTPSAVAPESSAPPVSAEPFGDGCATLPAEGPGSVQAMSSVPVATAAGDSPVLSRLAQALQAAHLVETFNATEDITVLAPADPAFQAVPADALNALLADTPQLTAVLTHHVIPGRLAPSELAGTHTTLNNDQVTIEGSGEDFTIGAERTVLGQAEASVVCGNLQTANATVYVIDQVLAPAG